MLPGGAGDERGLRGVRSTVAVELDRTVKGRLGHHAPEGRVVVVAREEPHLRALDIDLGDPYASGRQQVEPQRVLEGELVDQPREEPAQHPRVVVVGVAVSATRTAPAAKP